MIWEFKDLSNLDLQGISFDKSPNFDLASFKGEEI
jgi:hypothetical protein